MTYKARLEKGIEFPFGSHSVLFPLKSLKPSHHVVRKPRPHGEITCSFLGNNHSFSRQHLAAPSRHVSEELPDDSSHQLLALSCYEVEQRLNYPHRALLKLWTSEKNKCCHCFKH